MKPTFKEKFQYNLIFQHNKILLKFINTILLLYKYNLSQHHIGHRLTSSTHWRKVEHNIVFTNIGFMLKGINKTWCYNFKQIRHNNKIKSCYASEIIYMCLIYMSCIPQYVLYGNPYMY